MTTKGTDFTAGPVTRTETRQPPRREGDPASGATPARRGRRLERIPASLPAGGTISPSPGGPNPRAKLIEQIIEDLCPTYASGGRILYIGDTGGDTGAKWTLFEQEALERLGVMVDAHGELPDLVVHMPDENWLVLIEAVTSGDPIDAKRHLELKTLFTGSTAGLVFVSCFPSRAAMRKHLTQIAWETEVWCADHPTHLIHFNGERFLGPYA